MAPAVAWFRRDLRTDDHPALAAAAALGGADGVVPLFVVDGAARAGCGPNRRRFAAESVRALDRDLGGALVVRRGPPERAVAALAAEVGAGSVVVTADFGPYGRRRDREVARALQAGGRRLVRAGSPYAVTPGTTRTGQGQPFRVFTPFLRAWERVAEREPVAVPPLRLRGAPSDAGPDDLLPDPPGRAGGVPGWWAGLPLGPAPVLPKAGSAAAHDRLRRFVDGPVGRYASDRDRPAGDTTSRLSPHLHLGTIHPRSILQHLGDGPGERRLATELAWREFYADVLWHHPASAWAPLAAAGAHLRVDTGAGARRRFAAWATGTTGFPLVDAGMRQLLAEGWMHNRVRMAAASVLVKDLHLDWRWGARWFLWHLVDGDIASNNHGWQWVAGVGTDAAPFHRVFNPDLQRARFDPDGAYVRRYLPEAGGPGRPGPIVDHGAERLEALRRWDEAKAAAAAERGAGTLR